MTTGVGGSSFTAELAAMQDMRADCAPIPVAEFEARVAKAQALLREQGLQALYLDTSTSLAYFTGIGLKLQRADSDIAEAVMLHFARQDVPCLGVHDSFLVPRQHAEELVQVMEAA